MSVIAVVNRKGGSGKSTLATHIAAYCALRGAAVALGDIDRQLSSDGTSTPVRSCGRRRASTTSSSTRPVG
jgi:cellulose biosynthesis protein BcsQ